MGEDGVPRGCVPLRLTYLPSPKLPPAMGTKKVIEQSSDFSIHHPISLPDRHSLHFYSLLSLTPPPPKVSYSCPCLKLLPCILMTLEFNRDGFKFRV